MRKFNLNQKFINRTNLIIALLALILAAPTSINQFKQLVNERFNIQKTDEIYYTPPSVDVNKSKEGSCWKSIASERSDAARCSEGNLIHDPCFYIEDFSFNSDIDLYFCPENPLKNKKGVLLKINKDEMRSFRIDRATNSAAFKFYQPWVIMFSNGTTCNLGTGTTELAFGDHYNIYHCSDNAKVTQGSKKGEKYIFSCNFNKNNFYTNCVASKVIY